jgi:hypothetical protein
MLHESEADRLELITAPPWGDDQWAAMQAAADVGRRPQALGRFSPARSRGRERWRRSGEGALRIFVKLGLAIWGVVVNDDRAGRVIRAAAGDAGGGAWDQACGSRGAAAGAGSARSWWTSAVGAAAARELSRGEQDLIGHMIEARDRGDMVSAQRALDVLARSIKARNMMGDGTSEAGHGKAAKV